MVLWGGPFVYRPTTWFVSAGPSRHANPERAVTRRDMPPPCGWSTSHALGVAAVPQRHCTFRSVWRCVWGGISLPWTRLYQLWASPILWRASVQCLLSRNRFYHVMLLAQFSIWKSSRSRGNRFLRRNSVQPYCICGHRLRGNTGGYNVLVLQWNLPRGRRRQLRSS